MSTVQISNNALRRYFPIDEESDVLNQYSTNTDKHFNVSENYLSDKSYTLNRGWKGVLVVVSTSTDPNNYEKYLHKIEKYLGSQLGEEPKFSNNAYLGIIESQVLIGPFRAHRAELMKELTSTTDLSSYLLNIYALEQKQRHREASKVIFQYVETHFASSNLASVNALLDTIDLEKLSQWSIAGLVRFTGRARSHLPCWSSVFNRAKTVLTANGWDAEKLLAGIKE